MTLHTYRLPGLLLGLLCLGLPGFVRSAEPAAPAAIKTASAAQRSAIDAVLQSLARALTAADEAATLTHYDPAEELLLVATRREVQALRGRAQTDVKLRLARLVVAADGAEASVLRSVGYTEHQRQHMERRWLTMRLRRNGPAWRIVAEQEQEGVRTASNDLTLELLPDAGMLRGQSTLQVDITSSGADGLLLQLNRGLDITALSDERGRRLPFSRTADSIEVPQPRQLRAGERRVLKIRFAGRLFNESREQGYSQVAISPSGSFASWVTHWYPRLTGSASKAKGRLQYLVPTGISVASNGRLETVTQQGATESYSFLVERPLDFSFAAARYVQRTESIDGVQVAIYLLAGDDSKARLYQQQTARVLQVQRALYGSYPYDAYALVEIPAEETGGLGGSSEQGLNLFPTGVLPERSFPLPLVAHEIGHSWWGNLVKARDNAMLDEGLAQLSAMLCVLEIDGEAAMRRFVRNGYPGYPQSAQQYFARFATGNDHALGVAPNGASEAAALHDLADTKGMMVYSMLRDLIGQQALVQGLRDLAARFADRTITLADLQQVLQKSSGRKLDTFFQQWLMRTGAPELTLNAAVRAAERGHEVTGTISQTGDLYELDVDVVLTSDGKRVRHRVPVAAAATTTFTLPSDFRPERIVLDPEYKVLRWTPELRHRMLLHEGQALTSMRRMNAAVGRLEEYLARAPASLTGRFQLGVAHTQAGELSKAEISLRRVLDYYRDVQVFEPAVSASQLQLGRVLDLMGRRAEALSAYQQTLSLPDVDGSHQAAQSALITAYALPAGAAGPKREVLLGYAGNYASPSGIALSVQVGSLDLLRFDGAGANNRVLEWIEGSRFRVADSAETLVEFSSEPVAVLRLSFGKTVIELQRQK
jgi:tetratricopeptide (TPR) repeat protein